MKPAQAYALFLALLGAWGIYVARKPFKSTGRWSSRRTLIFVGGTFFVASCWLPAAALWWDAFRAWMVAPLGVCDLGMLSQPCYFPIVDRIRCLHAVRDALFVLFALLCFALALGFLPLPSLGL